jgi:hypothetical protein
MIIGQKVNANKNSLNDNQDKIDFFYCNEVGSNGFNSAMNPTKINILVFFSNIFHLKIKQDQTKRNKSRLV